MIQLHADALLFQTSNGEVIPCSAEEVAIEFIGSSAGVLDPELVRNAAHAVLHYFKVELGRCEVSVGEFAQALARVLRAFGMEVREAEPEAASGTRQVAESDLRQLASESGKGYELAFFAGLRAEMRRQLDGSPQVLRFKGLRGCVLQLAGARRWSGRCQRLNDQIVDYLRVCWSAERRARSCPLVVC